LDVSTAADPDEAAIEAVELQLSLLWRRARSMSHHLSRSVHPEMEPSAYGLLTILAQEGAMRLTDLAASVGVGKPSVSRQIGFLESIGLVRKEADPSDGRAQAILLTDKGAAQIHTVQAARKEDFHTRLAAWSETELRQLATLMAKLNTDYDKDFAREAKDHHRAEG
jgi:DNA-binding MarR family transcriptional regulator